MKRINRLLLVLPLTVVTFLYLQLRLAKNGCLGLIEFAYTIALLILIFITVVLAFVAIFYKRKDTKILAEPFALALTLITLAALFSGEYLGDILKGTIWLKAKTHNDISEKASEELILRSNGTFTVYLNEDDFACHATGSYKNNHDTLVFDKETVAQTNDKLTTHYLIKSNKLLPVVDTKLSQKQYGVFNIVK